MVAYLASSVWGQFVLAIVIVVFMGFAVKASVKTFVQEHSVNLSEILPEEDCAYLVYYDEHGEPLLRKEVSLKDAVAAVSNWSPSASSTAFKVSAMQKGEALISSSVEFGETPVLQYSPTGLELALKFADRA